MRLPDMDTGIVAIPTGVTWVKNNSTAWRRIAFLGIAPKTATAIVEVRCQNSETWASGQNLFLANHYMFSLGASDNTGWMATTNYPGSTAITGAYLNAYDRYGRFMYWPPGYSIGFFSAHADGGYYRLMWWDIQSQNQEFQQDLGAFY